MMTTRPSRSGQGNNCLTVTTTASHSSYGPSGPSRLCARGLAPCTDSQEFEGWPIVWFDNRS
jgi:hypothetical protein